MSITATELKTNLSKYLLLAEKEDIYITRNGRVVAKLTSPYQNRVDTARSLFGRRGEAEYDGHDRYLNHY